MAINAATLSDFAFAQPGAFELPSLAQNVQNDVTPSWPVTCMIPADAQTNGFIAFTYQTNLGLDSSIDVEFQLTGGGGGFSWGLETVTIEFRSMHWAVTLAPGQENQFRFALVKGGTIQGSENLTGFGGAGRVGIANIIVFYQRAYKEQEHWRWCHKCQGLFFKTIPEAYVLKEEVTSWQVAGTISSN